MEKYKLSTAVLIGVIFGMACGDRIESTVGDSIIDTAHATDTTVSLAPSDCNQWQVDQITMDETIPAGWEPFGWLNVNPGYDAVGIRRCTD